MNVRLGPACNFVAAMAALASAAALLLDVWTGGIGSLGKLAGAATGLAAAGLACGLLWRRDRRHLAAADRFVSDLCNTPPQQFGGDIEQLLPRVEDAGALAPTLTQLRDYLMRLSGTYQQSERDRARAEVRYRRFVSQSEQLREILQGLREPVLAINQYDELIMANNSAAELFHFDNGDIEKQAVATLIECQELVELLQETRRRRTAGQRACEVMVDGGDGEQRWYNATVESIVPHQEATDDDQRGAVAVLRDISDHKEIQRRHAEFISAVSHEMKTPLASIKAYVELLADGDAEDEATRDEFLDVINGQADRLKRLIDNLLNIARIEAGVVNVKKEEQSLNDVLDEAFSVVQPAAEQKKIQLNKQLSPMYLGVLIDRDMVLQTAINLLSNAVKYTPEGGAVTLRSRAGQGHVVFEVEDTGVGLSEEDAARVFDKFYRVKKDQQMAPGTGLGLPLAKHIVEDVHGGRLQVHSIEGQGSTFRASLPNSKRT